MRRHIIFFTFILQFFTANSVLAISNYYVLEHYGTLGGWTSVAMAINNNAQITGYSNVETWNHYHAYILNNGIFTDLGDFQKYSYGYAINSEGIVVGEAETAYPNVDFFIYEDGTRTLYNAFGGEYNFASDINNNDVVIGSGSDSLGNYHAFLFDGKSVNDLGGLGGNRSHARSINNLGQVVGDSWTTTGARHAVLYQDGTVTDLHVQLGFLDTCNNLSYAMGISDNGYIVGQGCFPMQDPFIGGSAEAPFFYDTNIVHNIGDLDGDDLTTLRGHANAVNSSGEVVGGSADPLSPSTYHAFIWQNGVIKDLNDFIPAGSNWDRLDYAYDINEIGQIVGLGYYLDPVDSTLRTRGFILSPDSDNDGVPDYKDANPSDDTIHSGEKVSVTDSSGIDNDLEINFGEITKGTTWNHRIFIYNKGDQDLIVQGIATNDTINQPFSILKSNCSGTTLLPNASCEIYLKFSPASKSDFTDTFNIDTSDPVNSSITFTVKGSGRGSLWNLPPSKPAIIFPKDGSNINETTVNFQWYESTDPEDNPVQYKIYLSKNLFFKEKNTIIAVVSTHGVLIAGFLLIPTLRKNKFLHIVSITSLLLFSIYILSSLYGCGSDSSNPNSQIQPNIQSYTYSALESGTTYYWKVVADDGDEWGISESETYSFTVQ